MEDESHSIYFHYKSFGANDFTEKVIPPIEVPFLKRGTKIKVQQLAEAANIKEEAPT